MHFNLALQHGFDDVRETGGIVNAVQLVMKRLKGCNSSKRRTILQSVCKEANIKIKQPILKVRNSTEMMLSHFLYLLPALLLIQDEDFSATGDDQQSWSQLLRIAYNNAGIIKTILPVLTCVSQWPQAFSTNGQVTIALVLLTVATIRFIYTIFSGS